VALYIGDSKLQCAKEFLQDFIAEAKTLTTNGVCIDNRQYQFQIIGLICDSPARSFLKCVKGHGGFYACERCVVKGVSVAHKRVYPQIDCMKRTVQSFLLQSDKEHHLPDITTPLLEIPNFDVIKSVPLNSMHLLYLGVMKWLLQKWVLRSSPYRIKKSKLIRLKSLLFSLESMMPAEFQRKVFDIDEMSRRKATQYRFLLLYGGIIIFPQVLSKDQFEHFLLLAVSCRILCNTKVALKYTDYADKLL